jgi:vitamin B12 transporter
MSNSYYCRPLLVILPVTFSALPLQAAEAQAPADTLTVPPVVVTATLVPMRADEVSATVTVLSGDALRANGIATLADALRTVPGVSIVATGSFGGQTSLFLRGGESDYVKVLVDGVPQNQPGGFFDFANFGIEDVDHVEIVRGPASVLYGSDAVTGVIQVFTRSRRGPPAGHLSVGRGTYETKWGTFALGGGANALSYGVTLSRHATAGIYPVNNVYERDLVSGRIRLHPDARTEATFTGRFTNGVFHFPTDYIGQLTDSNQYTTARGPSLALEVGRALSPRLDAHLTIGTHAEDDRFDDGPDSPGDTSSSCCYHSRDESRRVAGTAWVDLRLSGATVLSGGGEIERQHQSGTTLVADRRNVAWFAQALGHLTTGGTYILGGRLDENQEFGAHLTGRAGLSWRLTRQTRLRGSLGTGFKEPSFYENFASGYVRGNPALRPEQSTSWEMALEQVLAGGRLSTSVTYFDQHFHDLIQYSVAPLGPDSVNYVNVGTARARGVEVSASASLGHGASLEASFSHTETRDQATGMRLPRRPTDGANMQLHVMPGWGRIAVSAAYTGHRMDLDYARSTPAAVALPGYVRVDAALEYRVSGPHGAAPGLVASLRVEDLFDARFVEAVGFRSPRRTILVGGELRFGPS